MYIVYYDMHLEGFHIYTMHTLLNAYNGECKVKKCSLHLQREVLEEFILQDGASPKKTLISWKNKL